jgi:hypothetical protein
MRKSLQLFQPCTEISQPISGHLLARFLSFGSLRTRGSPRPQECHDPSLPICKTERLPRGTIQPAESLLRTRPLDANATRLGYASAFEFSLEDTTDPVDGQLRRRLASSGRFDEVSFVRGDEQCWGGLRGRERGQCV